MLYSLLKGICQQVWCYYPLLSSPPVCGTRKHLRRTNGVEPIFPSMVHLHSTAVILWLQDMRELAQFASGHTPLLLMVGLRACSAQRCRYALSACVSLCARALGVSHPVCENGWFRTPSHFACHLWSIMVGHLRAADYLEYDENDRLWLEQDIRTFYTWLTSLKAEGTNFLPHEKASSSLWPQKIHLGLVKTDAVGNKNAEHDS